MRGGQMKSRLLDLIGMHVGAMMRPKHSGSIRRDPARPRKGEGHPIGCKVPGERRYMGHRGGATPARVTASPATTAAAATVTAITSVVAVSACRLVLRSTVGAIMSVIRGAVPVVTQSATTSPPEELPLPWRANTKALSLGHAVPWIPRPR